MENIDNKLQALAEKSAKKNKQKQTEAAGLLAIHFNDSKDYSFLVDWIMNFHVNTCGLVLTKCKLDDEDVSNIVAAFMKCESFQKNVNNSSISRGIKACGVLLKKNENKAAIAQLALSVIRLGERNGAFSTDLLNNFKRFIVDGGQLDDFMALQKVLQKDYEKNMFLRFLKEADVKQSQTSIESSKEQSNETTIYTSADMDINNTATIGSDIGNKTVTTPVSKAVTPKSSQTEQDIMIKQLNSLGQLLAEQVKRFTDANGAVATLRLAVENDKIALESKQREITTLRQELEQARCDASSFRSEKVRLEEQVRKAEAEITGLKERLKSAFQMDDVGKKQELETLKKSVSDALKAEYEEYRSSDSAFFNEDNFEANRASLQRVFKILKRFDFNLE